MIHRISVLITLVIIAGLVTLFASAAYSLDSKPKAANKQPASREMKPKKDAGNPTVIMETSMGTIVIELFEDKAPISVKNFLLYVDEKFYDGTIFHRVISTFMIQGGGFTADINRKPTKAPIKNEAGNGLKNTLGTIAMARTNIVDSATSQFFINVVDNNFLDHRDETSNGFGYAVFGKVVKGMDVVDKIKAVKTTTRNGMADIPEAPVTILSVKRAPAEKK